MFMINEYGGNFKLIYHPEIGEEINNPVYHAVCTAICEQLYDAHDYTSDISIIGGTYNYYHNNYGVRIMVRNRITCDWNMIELHEEYIRIATKTASSIKLQYLSLDFDHMINLAIPR